MASKVLPAPQTDSVEKPQECDNNPVGRVQELCQRQLRPLPSYTFECFGSDHPALRQFVCVARIADAAAASGRGVGRSKRLAKRLAAADLLRQLLDIAPTQPTPPPTTTQPPPPTPLDEATFQRLRVSKRLQSAARAGTEVGAVFSGVVRNRKAGQPLPPLTPPPAGGAAGSCCEQLLELGRTHRFGVQFLDDKALGGCVASDRHRSVVKLCTMPTIVVVGNGADVGASREEASRAAMDYLCLLTRESSAKK